MLFDDDDDDDRYYYYPIFGFVCIQFFFILQTNAVTSFNNMLLLVLPLICFVLLSNNKCVVKISTPLAEDNLYDHHTGLGGLLCMSSKTYVNICFHINCKLSSHNRSFIVCKRKFIFFKSILKRYSKDIQKIQDVVTLKGRTHSHTRKLSEIV